MRTYHLKCFIEVWIAFPPNNVFSANEMQYAKLVPGAFCAKNEPTEYQNILYMCIEGEPTISEYSVFVYRG